MDPMWFELLLRWIHILAGVVWIGHNYAGLVLVPSFRPYSPEQDQGEVVTSSYMGRQSREHAVFRYSSVVTWATGIWILWHQDRLFDALALNGYNAPIGAATWLGTVMLLNLWLVMWRHQKVVLGFVPGTNEDRTRCSRITFLSARTNTMLSIPLLFLMAAGTHAPSLFD